MIWIFLQCSWQKTDLYEIIKFWGCIMTWHDVAWINNRKQCHLTSVAPYKAKTWCPHIAFSRIKVLQLPIFHGSMISLRSFTFILSFIVICYISYLKDNISMFVVDIHFFIFTFHQKTYIILVMMSQNKKSKMNKVKHITIIKLTQIMSHSLNSKFMSGSL